jgi:hypothetical protein
VPTVKGANAAFRFGLEMCVLGVFVWWGFATEDGPAALLRGFGVALLTVAAWGTFGAPNAPLRASRPIRHALLAVIYGWAVAALWTMDQRLLALLFTAAAVLNTMLLIAFGQD